MRKSIHPILAVFIVLSLAGMACQMTATPTITPTSVETQSTQTTEELSSTPENTISLVQPVRITGTFSYSNNIITTYYSEQMVALVDMYGYITRDLEWEIPVDSQILGYLDLDTSAMTGSYSVDLPEQPRGTLADVDEDGQKDTGVQVYAVSYWPNLLGSPYSTGDDISRGWPNYLASIITDTENQDEVIGGKLVVWAPDANQSFPTGYGADNLLFTEDDPTGPVPAGYSIIDLDQNPFGISQEEEPDLALYEPKDVAVKDYSSDSYSDAFKKMFDQIRIEYAFNDVQGKAPDWDTLWDEIEPKVAQAEKDQDATEYYEALRDYVLAFNDGHVGLSGGDIENQVFYQEIGGGYGMALGETDEGKIIAIYITADGPADKAGIKLGAEITKYNDTPISDAVNAVAAPSGPFSTEYAKRYQQLRYLMRAPIDTVTEISYINPGGSQRIAKLTSANEWESYSVTSLFNGYDSNALPVEYQVVNSGSGYVFGYVKINTNYDDLNLIIRLFERSLQVFTANQAYGVIIDLRQNTGGANLGLAGFFTDQEIPLGQLEYYSETTGQFEAEGIRDRVTPYENQYSFPKMALLVGQGCYSACEIEAYGFSQLDNMIVVGETPTAGVEAEVARGQYTLPEGFSIQVPTGRFTLPDGSIFLEGKGVQPTITVPATSENLLAEMDQTSSSDIVLSTAVGAILTPDTSNTPSTESPIMHTPSESRQLLAAGNTAALEDLALENYDNPSEAGMIYDYSINLSQSEPLIWFNSWCAVDQATLENNYQHIALQFTLDGQPVDPDQLATSDLTMGNMACRLYYTVLDQWPAGTHILTIDVNFDQAINDGDQDYEAGTHTYQYTVTVASN